MVAAAFGAHAVRARLTPAMMEIYRTGALYHLVHAVAALAVAAAGERLRRGRARSWPCSRPASWCSPAASTRSR